ncbi:MAG TPA: sigma-54 dependent transcriptional regulator [Candidatus Acidoferrales bacterium]|jgi:DNA-binding NtrC family response regulator|nr:sigma-54 dependent transcriptional regulator [Candidatus Acidoferrales bacterium]
MPRGAILVVDDELEIREGIEALLTSEGFQVTLAETAAAGLQKLEENPYDLVLLDVSLPDHNGLDLLREIKQRDSNLAIILITAFGSIDMARAAFKSGAQDYITKPWSNDELITQVTLAIEGRRLREENVQLKRALKQRYNFPNIVGKSEKMLALFDLVTQLAPSRSTVLISGESGTGKELIAKAIHAASARADKAFIPVNTGSIPVDLLESQLFGHVKGAFTSAIASKKGLFEVADQGTIFFDEISTISPETQAKLLRVIQEREFMRLGSTDTIKVDVRILAASNEDLRKLVREGRFRDDLYHRLNVISLQLPPLRDRKEDIPLLVSRFIDQFCRENTKPLRAFTHGAMKLLMDYDWPGNVRELENVVERAVVLSNHESLDIELLPENVRTREIVKGVRLQLAEFLPPLPGEIGSRGAAPPPSLFEILEEVERRIIMDMLERTNWNQTEASERFQIPLSTLNQKIKRLGIETRRKPAARGAAFGYGGDEPVEFSAGK